MTMGREGYGYRMSKVLLLLAFHPSPHPSILFPRLLKPSFATSSAACTIPLLTSLHQ